MQRNFLVVAENVKTRESLAAKLRDGGYTVTLASTAGEALRVVRSVSVGAVLIACDRDAGSARKLRAEMRSARPGCRILFVTPFEAARNAADLLRFGPGDYIVSDAELFDLLANDDPAGEEGEAGRAAAKGTTALIEVIDVLVGLLEIDDHFFGGFSHQVMRLAREVGEEMGLEREVLDEIVISTLLRDIGKADLDREVREGNETYTPEQTAIMREHVASSVRLLEHIDMPWKVLPIIRHHHERYDGQGYPDSLKGREIPLGARIVAAVDACMAMVSDRPHRDAISFDEALDELERKAGSQFDPEIVEVLIRVVEKQYAARGQDTKPKILIIEPQEEFRRLLKMRLLNEGVEVEAIAELNGNLEMFRKDPPHLVLADMGHDGAEGFETLRKFRDAEELHAVPVALLAERDDRFHKLRALRRGVDDYILKTGDLEEVVARAENILTREAIRRGGKPSHRPRGITGQIENLPLPDIVQILSIGMKTACVTLTAGARQGKIWFREGALVHATAGVEEGEEAFFEMLSWEDGSFEIRHGLRTDKKTVDNDAMFLVMEGLRRIDESGAAL